MATPASSHLPTYHRPDPDRGAMAKFLAVLLGIGLAVALALAFWSTVSAQKARDDARKAAAGAPAASATPAHDMNHAASGATAVASPSYAGLAPENADALAAAHKPIPPPCPPLRPAPSRRSI